MPSLARKFRGTNIRVQVAPGGRTVDDLASTSLVDHVAEMYASLAPDDVVEQTWWGRLRPERSLIHPAEAFLQGIKKLRPALDFNTFDYKKSKQRRVEKRKRDRAVAEKRRAARMAPTAAMKAVNRNKIPRTGGQATDEEVRLLSRGKPNQRALAHITRLRAKKKRDEMGEEKLMRDEAKSSPNSAGNQRRNRPHHQAVGDKL